MRLVPRSLYGRLLALSAIATTLALIVAAFAIGQVLERFVMQGLDQRLDAQIVGLSAAVRADGTIDRARLPAIPDGWGWRVETGRWSTGTLEAMPEGPPSHLPPPNPSPAKAGAQAGRGSDSFPTARDWAPAPAGKGDRKEHSTDRPHPLELHAPDGTRLHARSLSIGDATIIAAAPRAIVDRPIRAAMLPLLASLAILGVALAAATLVQLRLGLRPLRALKESVAAVRTGKADRVPDDQPEELRPLGKELNALLGENDTALATARATAANLAHGLKTPLATLTLHLREPGRDPDGSLTAQAGRIDAIIRHHLARARAAVSGTRAATPLAPAIADLAATLARLHDRPIALTTDIADGLTLAIDAHDLDELTGNLLDNAFRHAASRVGLTARAGGRIATLTITDDGPGIAQADRARATVPGTRLDERGDGHGFGLAIARDIAELHGGTLALDEAAGGGLAATVTLPVAYGYKVSLDDRKV